MTMVSFIPLYIVAILCAAGSFFALLWVSIALFLGKTGDWSRLAERYPFTGSEPPATTPLPIAFVGSARYRGGMLRAALHDQGLYLATAPIFQFGHPPLLLPWHALHEGAAHPAYRGQPLARLVVAGGGEVALPAALVEQARPHLAA